MLCQMGIIKWNSTSSHPGQSEGDQGPSGGIRCAQASLRESRDQGSGEYRNETEALRFSPELEQRQFRIESLESTSLRKAMNEEKRSGNL